MTTGAANKSKAQPKGLGKGLAAMMGEGYSQTLSHTEAATVLPMATEATGEGAGVRLMDIEKLVAGPYQPRRQFSDEYLHELADSIEKNGIVQPILVRRSRLQEGMYEIIAGERRFRAAKLAKLAEVPVLLREIEDKQALEVALIENIQRQDLNPLEEAMGYQRLMDEFNYTQEQLATAVGKSRSHIANLLRLQALPESIKSLVDKGMISGGHARALLGCTDMALAEKLAERVWKEGLSVRQTELYVKSPEESIERIKNAIEAKKHASAPTPAGTPRTPTQNAAKSLPKSDDVLALEEMLSSNLGLRVSIDSTGNQTGQVVISYSSLTQLDEILRRLGGSI